MMRRVDLANTALSRTYSDSFWVYTALDELYTRAQLFSRQSGIEQLRHVVQHCK